MENRSFPFGEGEGGWGLLNRITKRTRVRRNKRRRTYRRRVTTNPFQPTKIALLFSAPKNYGDMALEEDLLWIGAHHHAYFTGISV